MQDSVRNYRPFVIIIIIIGSETWCLKEIKKAFLRSMERAILRAMGGQKVVDRITTEKIMGILGFKESIDRLATANGVGWYGNVPRRGDDNVLTVALKLVVDGKRKRRRPKKTWKKQMEKETEKFGLNKEDALRRDK